MSARANTWILLLGILGLGAGAVGAQSAFRAAGVVESTSGGFRFPDGTLQLSAASGMPVENLIRVSALGADFTTIEDALDSISGPSSTNRFLVEVGPGVHTVTGLAIVPEYVHLRGSGPNATVITSTRTSATHADAATLRLNDLGRISDLTIRNEGTSQLVVGLYVSPASRDTVIDNVVVEALETGGTGHFALYLNDAEVTLDRSVLRSKGGSVVSTALGVINSAGGFPRPLVRDSLLNGGNGSDLDCGGSSGTGYGIQAISAAPVVVGSVVCGDFRGISAGTAGIHRIEGSVLRVGGSASSFLLETTGSGAFTIVNSGVFYSGNKLTGGGSVTCVGAYKSSYGAADATCD